MTPRKQCHCRVLLGLAAVLAVATAKLALAQTATPAPAVPTAPVAAAPLPPAAGAPPAAMPQTAAPQTAAPQAAAPATAPAPATAAVGLPPQPPPPALPGEPTEKRGFLNDFGNWWDKSVADFKVKMKEQQTEIDDFNKKSAAATQQAMKNAADAWTRLPGSRVIEIQQVCPLAGNGAPDCASAATNVCKGKGFKDGQPLDIRTAEKCNASLWVSGQAPSTADCPVETVLLRVACQ